MNKIITGDSSKVLGKLEANSIDLTVTSPPYDGLYNLGEFDFETIAAELYRVTKPGGRVCWNVQDRIVNGSESCTSAGHKITFRELGFRISETIIIEANANCVRGNKDRHPRNWQYVFVMSKGKPKTFRPLLDRPNKTAGKGNRTWVGRDKHGRMTKARVRTIPTPACGIRWGVWPITVGGGHTTMDAFVRKEHPGLMPERLAADLIETYSNPGDLILDPFAGGGTTLKMAALADRRWLGIEINPEYVKLCRRRVKEATAGRRAKAS